MATLTTRLCSALLLAGAPALALAQTPPIKPGLWEMQSETSVGGQKTTQPSDRLKDLPPAVRAQLEATMKKKGIDMGAGGVSKICFTRESMDPARWGDAATCKTDYGARSNSSWKWRSVCTQPPGMTIDGEAIFRNPESYSVNTSMTMTIGGETKTTQRVVQGKWLGADCGDLKPFDPKR